MARRMTPAQFKSYLQQQANQRRQAINRYNQAVQSHNRQVKTAVDNYNREVRAYNQRLRANQQRVQQAIRQLQSRPVLVTRYITFRTSVETLHRSYVALDRDQGYAAEMGELLDLSERENANSLDVMNALLDEQGAQRAGDNLPRLQDTRITGELVTLSQDLDSRWRGALFALDPRNPDASRHFCTSAREIFTEILEKRAPDCAVLQTFPECPKTQEGRPTRRARIQFALHQKGLLAAPLEQFIDDDVDNIIELFKVFNSGTHGEAASISFPSLVAVKTRVEDGILYLSRVFA